ncbi:MAG: type I methionyl aminopeptidase [Dehalococcoidales bacterium]|nr:type I methionyl aminopeptidase [Dehalococcoidales bacterium]
MSIRLKSEKEIATMRIAGRIVAEVLSVLKNSVQPGMRTKELDVIAARELKRLGAIPSFKGYPPYGNNRFPASLCVSINEEIVHGIPGDKIIKNGDIVSMDVGSIYDGYQGDAALTVGVGDISPKAAELLRVTEGALGAGISAARDGARLGDIGAAIQEYAEARGFSVVREYTGHGIGKQMHEDPLIPNFGTRGSGIELKKGMTLAIEPMVNIGDWRTKPGKDGWVVYTADGSLSAHFEHTIAITDGEPEVLTVL